MVYSYIGLSKPVTFVNARLKRSLALQAKYNPGIMPTLTPGGIFASNLSAAAALAGESDMCVYTSLAQLLKYSDVILSFLPDKALKGFSVQLGRYNIKNKIICHFSDSYNADILDFNSANTYLSFTLPVKPAKANEPLFSKFGVVMEGYGKRVEEVKKVLTELNIKCTFLNPEEKYLCRVALNFLTIYPEYLKKIGGRILRFALSNNHELLDSVSNCMQSVPDALNTYNCVENGDLRYFEKEADTIKTNAIDEITRLYAAFSAIGIQRTESEENKVIERQALKLLGTTLK